MKDDSPGRSLLVPTPTISRTMQLPTLISAGGENVARRFLEFFAATIRNKNTRLAYYRAACHFLAG